MLTFTFQSRSFSIPARTTYVKVVERVGELSAAGGLSERGVLAGRGLGGVGDAGDGVLQLLVDEVAVGLVGRHVRVLQAGNGGSVEHGHVPLEHTASRCHLVLVVHVLQLLVVESGKVGKGGGVEV